MRPYGQYCPLAKAAEIIGDRWTLLIVRELIMGSERFNDIERGLPRISRSLLSQRLQALEREGLVDKETAQSPRSTSYRLSSSGRALAPIVVGLGEWGAHWAFGAPDPAELDPINLLWSMRGGVDHGAIPAGRTVIRFELTGPERGTYWLVLEPGDVSVCLRDPGFEVTLLVRADLGVLYEFWYGRIELADALSSGRVRLEGHSSARARFGRWFTLSPLAGAVRAGLRDGHPMAARSTRPPAAAPAGG